MNQTQQCAAMFELMLQAVAPQIARRCTVQVGYSHKVFIVTPAGSGVRVYFGRQAMLHADLEMIVREAALAAEQVAYGLSTASAIRLDADTRWLHEQRQLPCTD